MREKIKIVNKIRINHLLYAHIFLAALLATVAIYSFRWANQGTEETMAGKVELRELTMARAMSLVTSQFIKERKSDLILLSENTALQNGEEVEGRRRLKLLADTLKDEPISGVARADKNGILAWNENPRGQKVNEGVDVSDRSYFVWAQEQKEPGEVFISEPFIARSGLAKGKLVTVLAAPVFKQKKFNGMVMISVSLEGLTEKYLESVGAFPKKEYVVISNRGDVYASNIAQIRGLNINQYFEKKDWGDKNLVLQELDQAKKGREGALSLFLPTVSGDRTVKVMTAYTPINLGDQNWSFIIIVPYESVLDWAEPILDDQVSVLAAWIFAMVAIFALAIIGLRLAHRDGFIDGYSAGQKHGGGGTKD